MTMKCTHFDNVDETLYEKTLASGLKVYFMPKKGFMKQQAFFVTCYGGLYNTFMANGQRMQMPHGIAHFLEHQIFESAEGETAFEVFGKLGGDVNAFTSYLGTAYTVSCVDNFYDNLKALMDMVQTTNITEKSVEKEKGIIIQEIKMYEDEPDFVAYFSAVKSMYHQLPINIDVAGSSASVKSTTKEELEFCYQSFYTPKNMFVLVVGDLEPQALFEAVDQYQTQAFKDRSVKSELILEKEPRGVYNHETRLSFDVANPQFYLGFKGEVPTKDYLKKMVALKLANDVVFSRSGHLFNVLYTRGLVNNNFGVELNMTEHYGYVVIGGEGLEPVAAKEAIFEGLSQVIEEGFEVEDFERTKKKYLGHMVTSFNSIQSVANTILKFNLKNIDIFEYFDKILEVTYEEALEAFRGFYDLEDYTITWLDPIKKEGN